MKTSNSKVAKGLKKILFRICSSQLFFLGFFFVFKMVCQKKKKKKKKKKKQNKKKTKNKNKKKQKQKKKTNKQTKTKVQKKKKKIGRCKIIGGKKILIFFFSENISKLLEITQATEKSCFGGAQLYAMDRQTTPVCDKQP